MKKENDVKTNQPASHDAPMNPNAKSDGQRLYELNIEANPLVEFDEWNEDEDENSQFWKNLAKVLIEKGARF